MPHRIARPTEYTSVFIFLLYVHEILMTTFKLASLLLTSLLTLPDTQKEEILKF